MDEHDRGATLQLGEVRMDAAVSQIAAVGALGIIDTPVELEHVERVFDRSSDPSTSGSGSAANPPNRSGRGAPRGTH
jgi:hypothetical protein